MTLRQGPIVWVFGQMSIFYYLPRFTPWFVSGGVFALRGPPLWRILRSSREEWAKYILRRLHRFILSPCQRMD